MGMNTGASMVHFAEAEPMNRLANAEKMTNRMINGMGPMPEAPKKFAPFNAMMVPMLVYLK